MVVLIDSPVANTASIARALRAAGATLEVTRDPHVIRRASKLVLPGVGSFAAAMQWLTATQIDDAIRDAVASDAFLLGICVGHQLLFDVSHEMGSTRGLGLLRGEVRAFAGVLPVPQIGWNRIRVHPPVSRLGAPASSRPVRRHPAGVPESATAAWKAADRPAGSRRSEAGGTDERDAHLPTLFDGVENEAFYFVNSYAAFAADDEIAAADYGGAFTAAVQRGRVFGVQFHPEKSSTAGLRVLRNFIACK